MDKYKYQDKQKEVVRVKKLEAHKLKQAEKEKEIALNGGQNSKKRKPINKASSWSEKQEAKERKLDRQLKKQRKRDYLKRKAAGEIVEDEDHEGDDDEDDDDNEGEEDGKNTKENKNVEEEKAEVSEDDEADWDELAQEERLAKKMKKGKISKRDFEKQVGNMFADL